MSVLLEVAWSGYLSLASERELCESPVSRGVSHDTRQTPARETYSSSSSSLNNVQESCDIIKVVGAEFGLLHRFCVEAALALHHQTKHLPIRPARKEDSPRVQLVQRATNAPHINSHIVRKSQYDLRCTVEAGNEVRGDHGGSILIGYVGC